jgi:hypothetical protein
MTKRPPHASETKKDLDVTHDDFEITPNMLDRLVSRFVVEATCPSCDRSGYFIHQPGWNNKVNCKAPTCTQVFFL